MNWWEAMLVNGAASVIRTFVKNPKSAMHYQAVLQHIYDDLGEVLKSLKVMQSLPPAE